jgi:hypothetical protein
LAIVVVDEETNENQEENVDINVNDNNVSDPDENIINAFGAKNNLLVLSLHFGIYDPRKWDNLYNKE